MSLQSTMRAPRQYPWIVNGQLRYGVPNDRRPEVLRPSDQRDFRVDAARRAKDLRAPAIFRPPRLLSKPTSRPRRRDRSRAKLGRKFLKTFDCKIDRHDRHAASAYSRRRSPRPEWHPTETDCAGRDRPSARYFRSTPAPADIWFCAGRARASHRARRRAGATPD